jgi:uncharacterized protein
MPPSRRSIRCLPVLLFGWPGFSSVAASFDCTKASTLQETAICADSQLSKLDEDTAAAYDGLRAQLTSAGAAEVRLDQRAWLVWLRQTCPDRQDQRRKMRDCLRSEYSARMHMLQNGLQHMGGMTFFPRLKALIAPDQAKPQPGSSDPGFGVGRFSWPEIDAPTPRQAAWNVAIREQAVRMTFEGGTGRQPPADFEPKSVADSDVTVFYRWTAVNERFISLDLENGTYNYGAPHPNEYTISFHWWVDLGRALRAQDVFRPGSGWEAFLSRRCYEKLATGEHAQDLYETAPEAVAEAVTQVSGWTLDARKFEVKFQEYTVAARAAGPVSVELGWEELKSYLARGFDPAHLPQPIEARVP